jgi:hypothetical protein
VKIPRKRLNCGESCDKRVLCKFGRYNDRSFSMSLETPIASSHRVSGVKAVVSQLVLRCTPLCYRSLSRRARFGIPRFATTPTTIPTSQNSVAFRGVVFRNGPRCRSSKFHGSVHSLRPAADLPHGILGTRLELTEQHQACCARRIWAVPLSQSRGLMIQKQRWSPNTTVDSAPFF